MADARKVLLMGEVDEQPAGLLAAAGALPRGHREDRPGAGMSKTITEMTAEIREVNTALGWRTGGNTFGDYIALAHSELSEALEAYRDHRLEDATGPATPVYADEEDAMGNPAHLGWRPGKPEGVGSEFADVLIRVLDMADIFGIDLAAEYERKIAYNRTRPYQHGGRTLSEIGREVG